MEVGKSADGAIFQVTSNRSLIDCGGEYFPETLRGVEDCNCLFVAVLQPSTRLKVNILLCVCVTEA